MRFAAILLLTSCGPPSIIIHNPTSHPVHEPSIHWLADELWPKGLEFDLEIWFTAARWGFSCPEGTVPDWTKWDESWCRNQDGLAELPGGKMLIRLHEEEEDPACLGHTGLVHEMIHAKTGVERYWHEGGEWLRQAKLEEKLYERDPNCGGES
jgi:hypothetical protein